MESFNKTIDGIKAVRTIEDFIFYNMIGRKVIKCSFKPFKSGQRINTVKGYAVNPYTNRICFRFEEDDSVVECFRCAIPMYDTEL